jgi:hypothetical protein
MILILRPITLHCSTVRQEHWLSPRGDTGTHGHVIVSLLICAVYMSKCCNFEKKIDLEILTDLHLFGTSEQEKMVFGIPCLLHAGVCAPRYHLGGRTEFVKFGI